MSDHLEQFAYRIGHGYDIHRLRAGGQLVLGGVVVSRELSAEAYSDGDVVIHAVVDALLGALGRGDIGRMFPDTDPRWKKADSKVFLSKVFDLVRQSGRVVGNLDVTILAERPRLAPFRDAICTALAGLLSIDVQRVNIKACTNEGCDAIGRGEAIAAHAVLTLVPAGG